MERERERERLGGVCQVKLHMAESSGGDPGADPPPSTPPASCGSTHQPQLSPAKETDPRKRQGPP